MNKITPNSIYINKESWNNSNDGYSIYINNDSRAIIYNITKTCLDAICSHKLGLIEGKLLSQSFLSAFMISQMLKNKNDYLQYNIECNGPIGGISVECKKNGDIRGYVHNNPAVVTSIDKVKTLSDFLGPGFITCSKHIEGFTQAQKSSVMLQTGNIPYDTAVFFKESEQIDTYIAMWVNTTNNVFNSIQGLMIQALPNANDETLQNLQNTALAISDPYDNYKFDYDRCMREKFVDFNYKFLDKKKVQFFCPCSEKHYKKIIDNLKNDDIFENDNSLDVTCSMCGSNYLIKK